MRIEQTELDFETIEQLPIPAKSTYFNKHSLQPTLNGGIIVYDDALPEGVAGCKELFLDFETTSCDPEKTSLNPFRNCWPCGVAFCCDNGPGYYIPINSQNEQKVYKWLFDIFSHPNLRAWINHNISYDAHVLYNCAGILPANTTKLIDTMTLAKLIDSDRFRHNLTVLSNDWLQEDISQYEHALKPYLFKNKDYGIIPIDIIGPYGCQDVMTTRKLYRYIQANLPESCNSVRDTEIALTKVLIQIERNGLKIDVDELQQKAESTFLKMLQIEEELHNITGRYFRPHTNNDCFDILVNYYGLPVLGWTAGSLEDDGTRTPEPSFDKHALASYSAHPSVQTDTKLKRVVGLITEYRKENTTNNLFVKVFKEQNVNGIMHPHYNQCVRSGRLSCQKPNAQQNNKESKALIHPYSEDELMLTNDFSQIEFRLIAHYIENPYLIKSYRENPDTDFHVWVAEMCEVPRKPAKSLNFGLGFNMGKAKLIKSLALNMDLVGNLMEQVRALNIPEDQQQAAFYNLAEQRGAKVYNTYHNTLPEMKKTSRRAGAVCLQRGYVFNLYGRQRHLPPNRSHTAFNFLNQSSAADLMKERLVFLHELLQDSPIKLVATVHDELLFSGPKELIKDTHVTHTIAKLLETPNIEKFTSKQPLLVPIRVSMGYGDNWAEAGKEVKDGGNSQLWDYKDAVSIQEFEQLVKG